MTSFATPTELGTYLGVTIAANDARAQLLLDLASAAIRRETGQQIDHRTADAIVLKGSWGTELELPQRPVLAVSAVSIDDGVANTAQVLNTDYGWKGAGVDTLDKILGHWGGPRAAVHVTYEHGYAVIPDDIKAICLELAARAWSNPASSNIKSETAKNYSVTYADSVGVRLTADEKADLRSYRRRIRSILIG